MLYTKDGIDIKRHELINHCCYADDIQLYFYCMPEELDALARAFGAYTEELCAWMKSNRVKLNCEKTEFMCLCTKQCRKTSPQRCSNSTNQWCTKSQLVLRQSSSPQTAHLKRMLMVLFSAEASAYHARSLPSCVLQTLLHAFVSCHLDYCNFLMAGLPLCDIQRLLSIQIDAACLFGGVSKRGSVVPVLHNILHWLPIKQPIDFKIGILSFKAINGLAPS